MKHTTITETTKTKLYELGPIPRGTTETKYYCPIDGSELLVNYVMVEPDDFTFDAKCENCNESWEG